MFPRNVQIPEWMVEGLAAFFEAPNGAIFPTVGMPSCDHLISFKHLQKLKKLPLPSEIPGRDVPDVYFSEVLNKVVSDSYFRVARQRTKETQDRRDDEDAQRPVREAWETARSTSWAFIYFLDQERKLHYLFRYGEELNKLPRDMDLNDSVLQGCFAKAFDMTDNKQKKMARDWFLTVQRTNLHPIAMQGYFERRREKQDPPAKAVVVSNPGGAPKTGGIPGAYPSTGGTIPRTYPPTGGTIPGTLPPNGGKIPGTLPPNGGTIPGTLPPNGAAIPGALPPNGGTIPGTLLPNGAAIPGGNQGQGLAGTSWTGKENLQGYDRLTFQLNANGQAIMSDKDGNTRGTWSQVGNNITLRFGSVTYSGDLQGARLHGTATNGKDRWNWSVSK
jgi:hypothetical protein